MSIFCRDVSFIYKSSEKTVHLPQFIAIGSGVGGLLEGRAASSLPISAWLAAVLQVHKYISNSARHSPRFFAIPSSQVKIVYCIRSLTLVKQIALWT